MVQLCSLPQKVRKMLTYSCFFHYMLSFFSSYAVLAKVQLFSLT